MDWRVHPNITTAQDFWALWDADQDAFAALGLAQGAERSGVAAFALLLWDVLTTMDDEVNLIWPSDWTLPKSLYLFVRYYSLITLTFHTIDVIPCLPWLIFEIISTSLVELAAEVIIILRVYAVYGARRKVLQIMLIGFGLQVAIMAVSLGLSMPKIVAGFYCKAADLPAEMVIYSTASIVFETFLFGLMMVGVIRGSKEGVAETLLLRVIVRDGAIAFLGVFLAMVLNTILFTLAPTTLVTVGFPWLLAILGAAGSRLVLKVRVTHANNMSGPSSFTNLQYTTPSHMYSAVNLDEEFPHMRDSDESSSDDQDLYSDREDVALNPSRSNSGSRHTRAPSDVESQSPPSPLSPETCQWHTG
ncbi:hypothetical protein L227DRAFT_599067 [Lentinus tigrinus ALCF2SS1-6]|uniref:DUF6533 domain-containing protein n=1 Tax=Lentinus tigrinus ALCF2SS1-6 TaxID=1328759 RepID=A0A5C2SIH2_9APHY|nr:hypothetical protein L227DRAFT_599067 [Lentinus tigrinus ALCF2SS1-6]